MLWFQSNLLPPHLKAETRYAILRAATLRLGVLALALVLLAGVAALPSYFLARLQAKELTKQAAIAAARQRKSVKETDDEVARIQRETRAVKSALGSENSVSDFFASLFSSMPPGVSLESADFDLDAKTLAIRGAADKRGTVAALESYLKSRPDLANVQSPLANLMRETGPKFIMTAAVK